MKFEIPRGMRDLQPKEYQVIEVIKQKFFDTAGLFGFNLMEPSPLESLSTLEVKSGSAIKQEIYGFKDKGGRDIALRFDLTIGLTRYVTSRRDMRLPVKLASFGGMFRYDEPQLGRYRWFHQWDVEIYDSFNLESDAEVIEFTAMYLESLGLDVVIDVCDRELLEDFICSKLHVSDNDTLLEMLRAVDKVPKKGDKAVLKEYSEKGFDTKKLEALVQLATLKGNTDKVLSDDRIKDLNKTGKLEDIMDSLKAREVKNARINMGIVRGLDYYSGIVFEVFDKSGDGGALVGGGRYDTLTAAFGRSDMGATGAAGGIERMVPILLKKGSADRKLPNKSVFVAYVHDDLKQKAMNMVSSFRRNGMISEFDMSNHPLKKQLEEASKRGYMFTAILAPEELSRNELIVRNMETGSEFKLKLDDFTKDPKTWLESNLRP
ncbi:MAG: histidine--tRNA ligase [Nitrososphaerales archaeon]